MQLVLCVLLGGVTVLIGIVCVVVCTLALAIENLIVANTLWLDTKREAFEAETKATAEGREKLMALTNTLFGKETPIQRPRGDA